MAQEYTKILLSGLQASYDALEEKDVNKLYFCTDSGKLYKGTVDFTDCLVSAESKPEKPVAGKLYVLADSNTIEAYVNSEWKVISYPMATTVDLSSDDLHVASAKAVYAAINKAVEGVTGGSTIVSGVEAGETAGTLKVTKGDGTNSTVTLTDVVTKPTWNAAERKLTIPVTGGDAVEVNIGKDVFVDPKGENKYDPEQKKIIITLNDAKSTKIEIPVEDLVTEYVGVAGNGATTTVTGTNIKVDLKLDSTGAPELTVDENGLKLDLTAYAKSSDVTEQVEEVQNSVTTLEGKVTANTSAIAKLNGSASEAGSVAKQIADAVAPLNAKDTTQDGKITALETDNATNKAGIAENKDNIAALATATTEWGTF